MLADRYQWQSAQGDNIPTLSCQSDEFILWTGPKRIRVETNRLKRDWYEWVAQQHAEKLTRSRERTTTLVKPNETMMRHLIGEIAAITHVDGDIPAPSWVACDGPRPNPLGMISCRNCLIDTDAMIAGAENWTLPHTACFWNFVSVEFDYDPGASCPRWLEFLHQTWPDDDASIHCLQQWFGLCLTSYTDLQKMLLLHGPTRSGKGVIGRVLERLLGAGNVAGSGMHDLTSTFALHDFLDKSLIKIPDAVVDGKNASLLAERFLSIVGEDTVTIQRKYHKNINAQLRAKIMLVSNETPRLPDNAGALAARFVILKTQRTVTETNRELSDQLYTELSGIMNWALQGLMDLRRAGRFTEPESSLTARTEMIENNNQVLAFVNERCLLEPDAEVETMALYAVWNLHRNEVGIEYKIPFTRFSTNLLASFPSVSSIRGRNGLQRTRKFRGIRLNPVH